MNVIIRKMTVDDVPAAAQLDRISFSMPWPEHAFYYEVKDNPAARCFVAEADDRHVIGMVVSWIILDELHIATLAVDPEYRRQGIGERILTKALQDGQAAGTQYALLEVRAGNVAAQNLYRKFGFKPVGRRPKYYKDNGEDAILMNLDDLESP
ncbi:MAG TPA: ribosomal protein S18-alanine N-acetyltransferase [Anaerolineales bacterium]|nr:ribosomal protein S18-alanine N-acetyltransferase [Anaerolineales bacterium]